MIAKIFNRDDNQMTSHEVKLRAEVIKQKEVLEKLSNQVSTLTIEKIQAQKVISGQCADIKSYRKIVKSMSQYKVDHNAMIKLERSFWKRLIFLFKGV